MDTGATPRQWAADSSFNNNADNTQLQDDSIISCFEHQRLSAEDFSYANDFQYLIEQELPCFSIEVRRGKLSLLVGHYLAKIILPSGLTLEILPKISSAKADSSKDEARKWVANMLQDIGSDDLGKTIAAIDIAASPHSNNKPFEPYASNPRMLNSHGFPNEQTNFTGLPPLTSLTNHQVGNLTASVQQPWYQGLLAIISDKLQQTAQLLPNRYRTEVNNSPKAQGKINLTAQLKKNWHRPHYLYTEQSLFDVDQLLVQFLATAWQQLQRLAQGNTINASSSVQQLPSSLQGVATLPAYQWQSSYQQLLQNKQAWVAQFGVVQAEVIAQGIEWGWWLLTHSNQQRLPQSSEPGAQNGLPVAALMINMNHAFERWVLGKLHSWVNDNLAHSRLVIHPSFDWLQQKLATSAGKEQCQVIQKLIPDACVVTEQEVISHVIDIKYKVINRANQISGGDWQQLSVYQQYLNCRDAWLIFPKTKNFKQRLDVFINLDQNMRSNQNGAGQYSASENCTQQMSAIAFDPEQSRLLV